jgi:cyclic pyranopterin phosphate synthase
LIDRWGRPVTDLRISVTNSCNYNCFFCHREGHYVRGEEMRPEEIGRLMKILSKHGVKRVKLTGGEPLMRRDLEGIVSELKSSGAEEVSLVTNGYFLVERARDLREAGLDRINISLHSLKRDVYERITGVDGLERVIKGIDEALLWGLKPIKLNFTALKGINEGELWDIVEFGRRKGLKVQLIELLDQSSEYYFSLDDFERELDEIALRKEIRDFQNRPIFELDGVTVEIVKGSGNPSLCMGCTRLRVTAEGFFKTCISREDTLVDFISVMRSGGSDEEIFERFKESVRLREPLHKLPGSSPKYEDVLEV